MLSFQASQRVEAIRLTLTEQREKAMEKIRNKRIKVLRRLARQRNIAEPQLSGDTGAFPCVSLSLATVFWLVVQLTPRLSRRDHPLSLLF